MNNLKTSRTFLRHFILSDFDSLKLMLMDKDVMFYTGFKEAQSESKSKELLEKWMRDDFIWASIDRETKKFVGWFMLKETISKDYPEIGFMLDKNSWGQGFATEIALGLIKFAKEELKVSKVLASADIRNTASIRVLEKVGMSLSNTFPPKGSVVYYEVECR